MNENELNFASPFSRFFGRRKGRPLHVHKAHLMEDFLPKVLLTIPSAPQRLDLPRPLWLEIGFGGGEHLVAQAKLHPEIQFIGCEPFVNGVASLLKHLEAAAVTNVRVYNDDARHVLDALPDGALDRCFVLFADPWPKKRHAERRFIGRENLDRIARALKPGAILRLASDHPTLIEWMREQANAHEAFVCVHESTTPPEDWVPTRYQEKAVIAGRQPFFMDYRRK